MASGTWCCSTATPRWLTAGWTASTPTRAATTVGRVAISFFRGGLFDPTHNVYVLEGLDSGETLFYGVQQMTWYLQNEGHAVKQKRIRRLMRLLRLLRSTRSPIPADLRRGTNPTAFKQKPGK